ncbi:hypothetical protein ACGFS9_02705 [Streptomyces sp. NPDC048566]|uniref:hypothetical protein n=1 Tax=Streptomyces sp. NPDC048566 TaxID=3365569 RepID=UPI0037206666
MSETRKTIAEPDNTHVTGGEDGEEITPLNTHVTSSPIKPLGTTDGEATPDNTHVTDNPA